MWIDASFLYTIRREHDIVSDVAIQQIDQALARDDGLRKG
jgi:hypothetical protein